MTFKEELHQLVAARIDSGTDPEAVLDALELESDVVRVKYGCRE